MPSKEDGENGEGCDSGGNKSCRNPGQPSRVVASLPHSRYKEMLLMVSQRGEVVSDPQIVCYW